MTAIGLHLSQQSPRTTPPRFRLHRTLWDPTQGTPRDDRDGARHRRYCGRDAVYLPGLCAPLRW